MAAYSRDQFHPTRAAKNWPAYTSLVSKQARNWGALPSMEDFQRFMDSLISLYNHEIMRLPFEHRPEGSGPVIAHGEMGIRYGGVYADGFNIFAIAPAVRNMVQKTTLTGICLGDLKAPYRRFYVGFESGTGIFFSTAERADGWEIDGAYIGMLDERDGKAGLTIEVCLTTKDRVAMLKPGYYSHWAAQWEPHYSMTLQGDAEMTFAEALGYAIESGEIGLEVDPAHENSFRSGVVEAQGLAAAHGVEVVAPQKSGFEKAAEFKSRNLATAREGLALVLGVLCALSDDSGTISSDDESWPEGVPVNVVKAFKTAPTAKARRKAEADLKKQGFASVRYVVLGQEAVRRATSSERSGGGGRAAHWRAGHFRRQRHGQGRTLTKIIWIMPHFVGSAGEVPEGGRLYRVVLPKDVPDSSPGS